MPAHVSEPRLLVLHGLRLKGFAEPDAVAAVVGLTPADVRAELEALQPAGLVVHREGRLTGWSLTREGRAEHEHVLAAELDAVGCRPELDKAYRRFLDLNQTLLAVCTDWQMRDETTLNDHTDAAYDAAVVDRLADIHARVSPIVDDVAALLARFAGYSPRLNTALGRLQAGERDYLTKPIIDSYHTVWFELHEDLLATLGLERSKEEAGH